MKISKSKLRSFINEALDGKLLNENKIRLDPKLRGKSRWGPGHSSIKIKSEGDNISYTLKPGESLADIAKKFGLNIKKLKQLNQGFKNFNQPVEQETNITIPAISLPSIGEIMGTSGSSARYDLAKAFDKLAMASPEHGAPPELVRLIEELKDTAVYEFQLALEPYLQLFRKAMSNHAKTLWRTGKLSPEEGKELIAVGKEKPILFLSMDGFLEANKKMLNTPLVFKSPTGKNLAVKPTPKKPDGVTVKAAIEAFLKAGGSLEDGDVDPEELELQHAVRLWLGQKEYWEWARNSAAAAGYYGVGAKKGLKYDPKSGIGQF